MKIVPIADLPVGWESQSVLLMHQAFGSSWDPRRLGKERQYPPYTDYVGLCAMEGDRIVASLAVHRFPFRSRVGDLQCSGLGGVATLPTHRGRGFAKLLIAEAHARERESGIPYCLLFTGRSSFAHSLYEKLGYRDVFEFPRAVREVTAAEARLPTRWGWRRAAPTDRRDIERIHGVRFENALGFTRRGVDWWPGAPGWFVLERNGRLRAYAKLEAQGSVKACHEAIGRDVAARRALLSSLEREVAGRWLLLGTGPLREFEGLPRARSYSQSVSSYGVLMAKALGGSPSRSTINHILGTDGRAFAFGSQDAF